MTGFVLRRILSSALVIVVTSMFVFVLFFVGMGDRPAENYCDQLGSAHCTPLVLGSIERDMGLDRGVVRNYRDWAQGIFVGRKNVYMDGKFYDCPAPCLGISIQGSEPVSTELEQRYPATLTLAIGGAAIYLVGGVILGALAAHWRGRTTDRLIVGGTLAISSIPLYVIALLAWVYFTLKLQIFPNTGYYPITEDPFKTISYMMLPWLVLGLTGMTSYARFTRGQMVETFDEDYMRTAQSKGLPMRRRLFKHALRASIGPVITIFGLDFAGLLVGVAFVEQIFGINGIAFWSLNALQAKPIDINVVSASVLVATVLIVVANLVVDVLHAFLDPRVVVD
jgi:peptide/nickel transport system permease protein